MSSAAELLMPVVASLSVRPIFAGTKMLMIAPPMTAAAPTAAVTIRQIMPTKPRRSSLAAMASSEVCLDTPCRIQHGVASRRTGSAPDHVGEVDVCGLQQFTTGLDVLVELAPHAPEAASSCELEHVRGEDGIQGLDGCGRCLP